MPLEFQMRLDADFDNRNAERFGDVIHRAKLQAFGFVLFLRHCRNENHGNVPRLFFGFQGAADLIAVHAGHHDVQQNHIRRRRGGGNIQRLRAVGGKPDGIVRFQGVPQDFDIHRHVINNQHNWLCGGLIHNHIRLKKCAERQPISPKPPARAQNRDS